MNPEISQTQSLKTVDRLTSEAELANRSWNFQVVFRFKKTEGTSPLWQALRTGSQGQSGVVSMQPCETAPTVCYRIQVS